MKLKRTIVITLLALLATFQAQAQFGVPNLLKYDNKPFHFGFSLGYNLFDYRISSKPDLAEYDSLMVVNTHGMSQICASASILTFE